MGLRNSRWHPCRRVINFKQVLFLCDRFLDRPKIPSNNGLVGARIPRLPSMRSMGESRSHGKAQTLLTTVDPIAYGIDLQSLRVNLDKVWPTFSQIQEPEILPCV
jgi:hypothetical protein